MSARDAVLARGPAEFGWRVAIGLVRPLALLMAAPSVLFLATLCAMLFRPPDLQFFALDRVALGLLLALVAVRVMTLREPIPLNTPVLLPLAAITVMGLADLLSGAYQVQCWSVFVAKWASPLLLYVLAQSVFRDSGSMQRFETFALLVLAYLILMALFYLFSLDSLVWPRYILDPSLGIHFDRARGPFLQAVANGVSLNLLGIVALNAFRRGRLKALPAMAFLLLLPLAVLATKTRGVWLSFLLSVILLFFFAAPARVRRACGFLLLATTLGALAVLLLARKSAALSDRLEESSPVEFRLAVYRTGWEMLREKPILGWRGASIRSELSRRIDGFHGREFVFHNSFLEVAVNHGLAGLALYLWVLVDLLRLGRKRAGRCLAHTFADLEFRSLWPVMVGVYALNACFVVMNYQFVNGLVFTVAGILAAQDHFPASSQEAAPCR
ncbi:MAG TPA: O-antigen ligase family protein [Terriglobales bacterium]